MDNPNPLPLAVAVCDGDIDRVEALLDDNEPINKRDYKGRTALVLALLSTELDIAHLLLRRGADPNLHDARGRLPLNLALHLPDLDLVERLMDRGTRLDADRKGLTPLHLAAARGCAGIVSRLMQQGASLDARQKAGSTPLHLAAANKRLEATRALLRGQPDLEARDHKEQTPLHVAVKAGANGVAKLLLDHGANPSAHARFGVTPLDMAYRTRNYEIVGFIEGVEAVHRITAGLAAASEHLIPASYCEELEHRLETLRQTIGPITNEPRFNVNRFLEVFDRIRLEDGHLLDYYHDHLDGPLMSQAGSDHQPNRVEKSRRSLREFLVLDDLPDPPRRIRDPDAQPYVFTRPLDANRAESARRARDLHWRRAHLMEHLTFERSPEGLLQWVIFRVAVNQFHLCWHANYNDLRYILSPAGLDRVLESLPTTKTRIRPFRRYRLEQLSLSAPFNESSREKLRALDLTPWVKVAGDLGEVRVFTFTKWGGFAWRHHRLRWPHHVDGTKLETVAEFNCGIRY